MGGHGHEMGRGIVKSRPVMIMERIIRERSEKNDQRLAAAESGDGGRVEGALHGVKVGLVLGDVRASEESAQDVSGPSAARGRALRGGTSAVAEDTEGSLGAADSLGDPVERPPGLLVALRGPQEAPVVGVNRGLRYALFAAKRAL